MFWRSVLLGTLGAWILLSSQGCSGARQGICEPYCDESGNHHQEENCTAQGFKYCCGDEYFRYCCDDIREDAGDDNLPESSCEESSNSGGSWWFYQWRVIVGLLVTLIILLCVAACCYYCCGGRHSFCWRSSRPAHTDASGRAVTSTGQEIDPTQFNPTSPTAFAPPDYDSLPKDPPRYEDVCGAANFAFEMGEPSNETSFIQENYESAQNHHSSEPPQNTEELRSDNGASCGNQSATSENETETRQIDIPNSSERIVSNLSTGDGRCGDARITPIEETNTSTEEPPPYNSVHDTTVAVTLEGSDSPQTQDRGSSAHNNSEESYTF